MENCCRRSCLDSLEQSFFLNWLFLDEPGQHPRRYQPVDADAQDRYRAAVQADHREELSEGKINS